MKSKEIVNIYFKKDEANDSNWTCKCGKNYTRKLGQDGPIYLIMLKVCIQNI